MRSLMKLLLLITITGTTVFLSGCGDDTTNVTVTPAAASCVVSGRVVDSSTLQPIANADVALLVNGEKNMVKSSSSTDPDLAGTFVFRDVPFTSDGYYSYSYGHLLTIAAPGFATFQQRLVIPAASATVSLSKALGNIPLGKGYDLTVVVTQNGIPVPGVTLRTSPYSSYVPALAAVTGADGIAVLTGLNQETRYDISNAPFYEGGILKFTTAAIGPIEFVAGSDNVVSFPLRNVTTDQAIEIVASNLLPDGSLSSYPERPNQRVILPGQVVRIVFNYPVTLVEPVSVSYIDDLRNQSEPFYGQIINYPVTSSLDATGTILTITNPFPYQANQTYHFNGAVQAKGNPMGPFLNLGNIPALPYQSLPFFVSRIYVADDTPSGLNEFGYVRADNFNGTGAATATTIPSQVYLEFPEKVHGSYTLLATRSGDTVTPVDAMPEEINFASGTILFAANDGGAEPTVVFRVPVNGLSLPDNSPASISEMTLAISVWDTEGNHFSKTVTMPVQ